MQPKKKKERERKEGRKKEGRKEGWTEGRKDRRKGGRKDRIKAGKGPWEDVVLRLNPRVSWGGKGASKQKAGITGEHI